jgi:hypothetical protein
MAEWKRVGESNVEVCSDGRVRRDGVEWIPTGKHGYKDVCIDGKGQRLHRLIAQAFIPNPLNKPFVDHIDGDPLNNCIENLRWATHVENMRNTKPYAKLSRMPKGVHKVHNMYVAIIKSEGKNLYLGSFESVEEASLTYELMAEALYGEFYRATGGGLVGAAAGEITGDG